MDPVVLQRYQVYFKDQPVSPKRSPQIVSPVGDKRHEYHFGR